MFLSMHHLVPDLKQIRLLHDMHLLFLVQANAKYWLRSEMQKTALEVKVSSLTLCFANPTRNFLHFREYVQLSNIIFFAILNHSQSVITFVRYNGEAANNPIFLPSMWKVSFPHVKIEYVVFITLQAVDNADHTKDGSLRA